MPGVDQAAWVLPALSRSLVERREHSHRDGPGQQFTDLCPVVQIVRRTAVLVERDAAAVPFEKHQLAAVGALVEVVATASSSARVGVIIASKRARRADLASGRGMNRAMTATGDVMADLLPLLPRTHA